MNPVDAVNSIEASEQLFRVAQDTLLFPNNLDNSQLEPVFG